MADTGDDLTDTELGTVTRAAQLLTSAAAAEAGADARLCCLLAAAHLHLAGADPQPQPDPGDVGHADPQGSVRAALAALASLRPAVFARHPILRAATNGLTALQLLPP